MYALQQQQKTSSFLKQHVCHSFAFDESQKVAWKKVASFKYDNFGSHHLQPICYDNYSNSPSIYFIDWQDSQTEKNIYIKQKDEQQWKVIELDQLPLKVKITDQCAFLIGTRQLIIVPFANDSSPHTVELQAADIVDIKLCFSVNRQSGIYVVYFDRKRGYYSQVYTKSSQPKYWSKIVPFFQSLFSKFEPYCHFQVILPNLLGLAIKSQTLHLFDLQTMKETSVAVPILQLEQYQKPNIKWKSAQPNYGYSDTLYLFLCRKNLIESFYLNIGRKNVKIQINGQEVAQKVQISRIIGGDIIDWANTSISKTEFAIEAGSNIIDYQVSHKELIYSYCQPHRTPIPTTRIVGLTPSATLRSEVLAIENNIYSSFLESKFTGESGKDNQPAATKYRVANGKKRVQDLHNYPIAQDQYRFYHFLVLSDKFWSVRSSTLTTFQPITHLQFTIEREDETNTQISQEGPERQNGSHHHMHQQQTRSLNEFRVRRTADKLRDQSVESQRAYYNELLHNFKRPTSQKFILTTEDEILQTYVSYSFFKQLTQNLVIDSLRHFNLVAEYCSNVLGVYQSAQQSIVVIKVSSLLEEMRFGRDILLEERHSLLDVLVERTWEQLQDKGGLSAELVVKSIFENILLDQYIKQGDTNRQQNLFLNVVIDLLIKYQQNQALAQQLHHFLKRYINKLASIETTIFQLIVSENSSVFTAFILSQPSKESITSAFRVLYPKKHYGTFITNLRKIKQFIPNQLQILLELQLNERPLQSKLTYKHFIQFTERPLMISPVGTQVCRSYIIEELVLFNSEQSFNKNIKVQKELLAELKQAPLDSFSQINDRIASLSQKQLSYDILKRDLQHIMEWEENMLVCYSQLFNDTLYKIQTTHHRQLHDIKRYLLAVLKQVESSMDNYCRSYSEYYKGQQCIIVPSKILQEGVVYSIAHYQSVMTNPYLRRPLKIYNYLISDLAIRSLRVLLGSERAVQQIRIRRLFTQGLTNDLLLLTLLQKQQTEWENLDLVQFILVKHGQQSFSQLLKKYLPEDLAKVVDFLQENKDKGCLYSLLNNITAPQSTLALKYRSPYVHTER